MRAAASDTRRQFFLRQRKIVEQAFIGMRFFHRVEVSALDVFDERDLAHLGITRLTHESRDFLQSREARRAQTAFPGDEFIP